MSFFSRVRDALMGGARAGVGVLHPSLLVGIRAAIDAKLDQDISDPELRDAAKLAVNTALADFFAQSR